MSNTRVPVTEGDPRSGWFKLLIPEMDKVFGGLFWSDQVKFTPLPFVYGKLVPEQVAFDVELSVPYLAIDRVVLVEIVERILFSIGLEFQGDLYNKNISEGLLQEFGNKGISLSDKATISTEETEGRWLIIDAGQVYSIRKEVDRLNIYVESKKEDEAEEQVQTHFEIKVRPLKLVAMDQENRCFIPPRFVTCILPVDPRHPLVATLIAVTTDIVIPQDGEVGKILDIKGREVNSDQLRE